MLLPKIWIICRVCLRQQQDMYNLFDDTFSNKNIWTLLRDCGGVPVRKNDDFPDQICETCLRKLWKAIEFRMDCQRGHRELIQKLMKTNEIMYEEKCSDLPTIANHNSSTNSLEEQHLLAKEHENEIIEYKNSSHNIREYSIVTQKEENLENVEQKNESERKKLPIVVLFKLKDKPNEKNECKTIATEAQSRKTFKLKRNKQTVRKVNDETNSKVIGSSGLDDKSIKTTVKSKLNRKNVSYACVLCKKIYKTDNLLRRHMHLHKIPNKFKNNGKNWSFKCDKCNKIFRFSSSLRKHARTHNAKKCSICNKPFTSLIMLRKHHQRKHLQSLN